MRFTDLINSVSNEPRVFETRPIDHTTHCLACSKKLRYFSVNLDWKNRQYHKSCFKRKQAEYFAEIELEDYMMAQGYLKKNCIDDIFDKCGLKSTSEIMSDKYGLEKSSSDIMIEKYAY